MYPSKVPFFGFLLAGESGFGPAKDAEERERMIAGRCEGGWGGAGDFGRVGLEECSSESVEGPTGSFGGAKKPWMPRSPTSSRSRVQIPGVAFRASFSRANRSRERIRSKWSPWFQEEIDGRKFLEDIMLLT